MAHKTVAPLRPSRAAPARRAPSTSRFVLAGGALVVVVAIALAVALSSGGAAGTHTPPATGYRAQIVNSLAASKEIAVTFARQGAACKSIECVGIAAGTALSAEGTASNLVHQTTFPATAVTEADGYVQDLIALQQDYKAIAEVTSRTLLNKYVASLATDMKSAQSDARITESALG
jgi:hypothetical protein